MGRTSRDVFKPKGKQKSVWLYISNKINNENDELSSTDKRQLLSILANILNLYSIECVSTVVLADSFHLILNCSSKGLEPQEIAEKLPEGISDLKRMSSSSNDIASFMKKFQSSFTLWYNRTRSRRRTGSLWESRYNCTLLADMDAVIYCMRYIELKSAQQILPDTIKASRQKLILKPLNHSEKKLQQQIKKDRNNKKAWQTCRHWNDGLAIGSKESLRNFAELNWGPKRAQTKKFGIVLKNDDVQIHSYRQLVK